MNAWDLVGIGGFVLLYGGGIGLAWYDVLRPLPDGGRRVPHGGFLRASSLGLGLILLCSFVAHLIIGS